MKILHVNDRYNRQGGVQKYILEVGELLRQHGHQNSILYTEQSTTTIQNGDWPAYHIPADAKDIVETTQSVIEVEKPDVAYIHQVTAPEIVTTLARLVPTVAYVHGFTAVCPGRAKYFRRGDEVCQRSFGWGCVPMHYWRRCSAARHPLTLFRLMSQTRKLHNSNLPLPRLMVASNYMKSLLVQNGVAALRITVLPPHFIADTPEIIPQPAADHYRILFAGRLEIEKGFPYLLQAMSHLPPSVQLLVCGDGTLRSHYEKMVGEQGLTERVKFLGWLSQNQMKEAYQNSALLVLPSIMPEPFGKVGIEALFHGRPVVAFDVGGISDWLHHEVNGLLVPPANSKRLAAAIRRLVEHDEQRVHMGRVGQREIAEQYKASVHLNQLLEAFASVEVSRS